MKGVKTCFFSGFNGQNMLDGMRKEGIREREVKKLMYDIFGFPSNKLA